MKNDFVKRYLPLCAFIGISLIEFLLCIHPLLKSTYLQEVAGGERRFMIAFLTPLIMYSLVLIGVIKKIPQKAYLASTLMMFAFLQQSATSVTLPLYPYVAGRELEAAQNMASENLTDLVFYFVGVVAAVIIMAAARWVLSELLIPAAWCCSGVNVLAGLLLIVANDKNGTTSIFHIQVGLPLLLELLVSFGLLRHCLQAKKPVPKYLINLQTGGIAALLIGYCFCKELGIPAFFCAAALLWYTLFLRKEKILTVTALWGAVLFLIGCVAGYMFLYYLPKEKAGEEFKDFLDIGGKVIRLTGDNYQANIAKQVIREGGLFGTVNSRYLPVWKTDYQPATSTHYLGIVWMLLSMGSLAALSLFGTHYYKQFRSRQPEWILPVLSFIFLICISTYNITANSGVGGIIGISCFAAGYGKMAALMSGGLFGFIMFPVELKVMKNE